MKVIVSVFGPKEATRFKKFSPKARLNVDLKMASFSKTGSRQSMLRTEEERDMGIQIEKAILPSVFAEKYPKCEIDISVLVLEMDGESSCLAACICASSLALADAGVELRNLVAASGVSVCNPNQVIADASEQEEKRQSGSVFVSVMPSLDEVTHVFYHGKVDASLVVQGFQIAVENANKYYQAMKEAL
jgi:exosome complex component MTR3